MVSILSAICPWQEPWWKVCQKKFEGLQEDDLQQAATEAVDSFMVQVRSSLEE